MTDEDDLADRGDWEYQQRKERLHEDLEEVIADSATTDIDSIFGAHIRHLVQLKKLREEIDKVLEYPLPDNARSGPT